MKKLGLILLFLSGCTQQGLVNTGVRERDDDGGPIVTEGPKDPEDMIAAMTSAQTNLGYLKTKFAIPDTYSPTSSQVRGFGVGDGNGKAYCVSNERRSPDGVNPDTYPCYTPLSGDNSSTQETTLLGYLGRSSAAGIPMIIQGVQLFFSNKITAPTAAPNVNVYAKIEPDTFKVTVKTAPIMLEAATLDDGSPNLHRRLYWNSGDVKTYSYGTSTQECTLDSAIPTTGFDLENMDLGANAKYLFLTGLWIFERAELKPFESQFQNPTQDANGDGILDLVGIYSTRTKVKASFLVAEKDENNSPYFKYFPSSAADKKPSKDSPAPETFAFGRYRRANTMPRNYDNGATVAEIAESESANNEGLLATPMLGPYNGNGTIQDAAQWRKRVVIGLCIRGKRDLFTGTTGTQPAAIYPVVHAVKYELRKLSVDLK